MNSNDKMQKDLAREMCYFNDEIIQRVNDINVLVQKLFHTFYSPHGLSHVQAPVLMALRRYGKMSVSELGRSLEIGASNMTPLCKRLERANMVTRTRSEQDQRVVYVEITDHALEILEQIEAEINERAPQISELAEKDGDRIMEGLDLLIGYLDNVERLTHIDKRFR